MLPPILHQDDRILVIDKPTGLLSVPGIGPEKADCMISRIQASFPEARIVHRLDRDTSGVIVLARDAEAHRELSRQFHDREVEKTYFALVGGHPVDDLFRVNLPIRKDLDNPPCQIVDFIHGKASVTDWRVTSRGSLGDLNEEITNPEADHRMEIARLELRPLTGRSHQLRVHLKVMGFPILGDDLYASWEYRNATPRLCLHSSRLWLVHPSTASPMVFNSPPPF